MKKVCAMLVAALIAISSTALADAKGDAEKKVKEVIAYVKATGKDVAVPELNKGKFRDGELYVTIYDLEGKVIVHPTKPALVGQNLMNAKDPDGVAYVADRVKIAKGEGKGWQKYKFMNPETKKIEPKEAYIELADGWIFSCGAYQKK